MQELNVIFSEHFTLKPRYKASQAFSLVEANKINLVHL